MGLIAGIVVLVGAIMIYARPNNASTWGLLVLIFSILSFFVLPALVTLLVALESFSISGRFRRYLGWVISGVAMAFVFGETYALSTATVDPTALGPAQAPFSFGALTLDLAVFGGVLMGMGALISALYLKSSASQTRA